MHSPVALWMNFCGAMPHAVPVVHSCDFSLLLPWVPQGSSTSATAGSEDGDVTAVAEGVMQSEPLLLPYRSTVVFVAPLRGLWGGCGHQT